MDYYLGQLLLVSFPFPPKGFALCNGQLLPVNQNQALYSLLGVTFGGNGSTTFGLPNLQGRTALGTINNTYPLGSLGGYEGVSLQLSELPSHLHTLSVSSASGPLLASLAGNTTGAGASGNTPYAPSASAGMATGLGNNGSSQPHENRSPYVTLNWIIALVGIYPVRS